MKSKSATNSKFFRFAALAYGLGWLFWIPAGLLQQNVMSFPTLLLHTLGGFSPSVAGIIMMARLNDREGRRDFWRRVIDFRRVGMAGVLSIFLFFPTVALGSILISNLLGFPPPELPAIEAISAQPAVLISMLAFGLLTGPLSEELGWRGFGLDALQARWGAVLSSLVLGIVWWGWHLPLFFIPGTTQYNLGIGTLDFWLFLLNILPLTFLITWAYNWTQRSILAAILIHYAFNLTTSLFFPFSPGGSLVFTMLLMISTLGIILFKDRQVKKPVLPQSG